MLGPGERLSEDDPQSSHDGHEARYHLAAGYCLPGDGVLDAACGSGYGAAILNRHEDITYVGVDRSPSEPAWGTFIQADLDSWEPTPRWHVKFDVGVCCETLEHLQNPDRFAAILTRYVERVLIVSVPTVPTKHLNEWHLHDFTETDIDVMFTKKGWRIMQFFDQPSELSGVWVFGR